eukprot:maker-scaffold_5-snap-gene-12.53-mRNA-1 protein AED:0.00 eAED:0.00 QI:114/1/1/1/1/1/2/114/275
MPHRIRSLRRFVNFSEGLPLEINNYVIRRSFDNPSLLLAIQKQSKELRLIHQTTAEEENVNALAKLDHKNVFSVLEIIREEAGRVFFLVSPQCAMREVFKFNRATGKSEVLPLSKVHEYFSQVVAALVYLDEKKVANLSICPENILVLNSGQVIVSDFSNMCLTSKKTQLNFHTEVFDVFFSAPELYTNPNMLCDEAVFADVYSLGRLLQFAMFGSLMKNSRYYSFRAKKSLQLLRSSSSKLDSLVKQCVREVPQERISIQQIADDGYFSMVETL